jgi:hypothetical protein
MWTNTTLNEDVHKIHESLIAYDIRTNILVRPNTTSSNAKDMIEFASYHFVLDERLCQLN